MAGKQRRAGKISVQANGEVYDAKGSFSYNLGRDKREAIVGSDKVHGYKEMPQVPFIEGEITDSKDLDLNTLVTLEDATITLNLSVGKTIMLSEAWYADEGTASTEEGAIPFRFEGISCEEI